MTETKTQQIEGDIILVMEKLDTEVYTIYDVELSEYFYQWCRITNILLKKLKYGTILPE